MIRADVGFRPFRRSGFVVRAEALGDKLLVHNYGHGGAGVTLSWGTAEQAVELIAASGRIGSAAVLGCGVVGLATARLLQGRGFGVTIHARELFGDRELTAVKGQLVVLRPQPEVDYAVLTDDDLYMFPRADGILLGGTHEHGVETREPNAEAAERILAGHKAIFDEMS